MAYTIKQNLVDKSMYGIKSPYAMKPIGITVHNTANDASAENEVAYMRRNGNEVSFHVAVDDDSVVVGIPFDRNAWHAGDGNGKGNRQTIGIEICYSKSGGHRFNDAEKNAAHYIATLLKENGWGIDDVYRHADFANKNCPHRTIALGWDRFLKMIQAELDKLNGSEAKPAEKVVEEDGLFGKDTTRWSQKVLGTPADGIVSNQLNKCKKYLPNMLSTSWEFENIEKGGSAMVRALQELVGAVVDGYAGEETVTKLQIFLANLGLYTGDIDGIGGRLTVLGWQKYLNMKLA